MTTTQLLHQLKQQLHDLHYREQRASDWSQRDEQSRLYASGALSVIHAQLADITYLIDQIESEGITDASLSMPSVAHEPFCLAFGPTHLKQVIHERPLAVCPTELTTSRPL